MKRRQGVQSTIHGYKAWEEHIMNLFGTEPSLESNTPLVVGNVAASY